MQEVKAVDKYEEIPELQVILEENFLQDEEGRWYIPDRTKAADIARLREKNLLREFEGYMASKGKLKLFRSEAIRAGFSRLWKEKNYKAIVDLADRLPEGICPVWAGDCVDLIPEGVDKGKAADLVIRKLHQPKHRTICFGDSDNDLELFRACAIRVAVGEPSPRLMAEMTYKTVSVQKDGAAQIIEALGFLKP